MDVARRHQSLDFKFVHLDAPLVDRLVERFGHLFADGVTVAQALLALHLADLVAEQRSAERVQGCGDVADTVGVQARIVDAIEHERICGDHDIVFGDDLAGLQGNAHLVHGDALPDGFERHSEVETGIPSGLVISSLFDHIPVRLRHDLDVSG